ncbi:MAG TPA: hypothetical protein VEB19_14390, partial [Gemmatimonadaceae bacterium]|nr:hypothetical protein [Gemmatimonadaceae bacterium]
QNDLVERLSKITGRQPARIQVPQFIANIGVKLAGAVGLDVSFNESQMKMLSEGNEIAQGYENALLTQFQVKPTPLDSALRKLAEEQDEQLPDEGLGPLRRKRYWAEISGSRMGPEQLMEYVKQHFTDLMASFIDSQAEPQAATVIEEDATLTLSLPLRGHVQVRVAESEPRVFTLVTLAGHPLSGAVRFLGETRGNATRFEIQLYDRAANVVDLVMMRTLGERLQDVSWREMIDNVVKASGGSSTGVQQESETLDDDQAERIEVWLREIVMERKRESAGI